MDEVATQSHHDVNRAMVRQLVAAPDDRRVLFHLMQEVRRHHKVRIQFGFSIVPEGDSAKDSKAGVVAARFISTTQTVIAPPGRHFRESERYGHFVYFGVEGGADTGEFNQKFVVPYHANKLVLTLMPFSNQSTKLTSFVIDIELDHSRQEVVPVV